MKMLPGNRHPTPATFERPELAEWRKRGGSAESSPEGKAGSRNFGLPFGIEARFPEKPYDAMSRQKKRLFKSRPRSTFGNSRIIAEFQKTIETSSLMSTGTNFSTSAPSRSKCIMIG